jgi:CHRD domain
MKKLAVALSLATVVASALTAGSLAGSTTAVSAKLTVAQEIPKQTVTNTAATGMFTATLTGKTLKFKLAFSNLTGPPVMAHIHVGAAGVAGPVLIWLCGLGAPDSQLVAARPCASPLTGTVTLTAAAQKDFANHLLYVNVHTAKNPGGEIRGQLIG